MAIMNHEYTVNMEWAGGRDGQGSVTGNHGLQEDVRTPPEFGGPGGATNPEELLASAVASCYCITFGIIASNRKIPFEGVKVQAVGQVEQNGASFVYNKITIRPTITLAAEATREHETMASEMAHKADSYCIITNAIRGKVEVVVEPTITRA